jgi:radical SAM protein with 4Fe4S-binding SPASM domain
LWINPVITWDGKVVPCCFDKDASHIMGDLNKRSFREIWHGKKYNEFRRSLLSKRKEIDICRNCTAGLKGVRY